MRLHAGGLAGGKNDGGKRHGDSVTALKGYGVTGKESGGYPPSRLAALTPERDNLGDQDSNLNKQYQKLLCYRYTIPRMATQRRRPWLWKAKNYKKFPYRGQTAGK